MSFPRDSQVGKVRAAQMALTSSHSDVLLTNPADLTRYATIVVKSPWWTAQYPHAISRNPIYIGGRRCDAQFYLSRGGRFKIPAVAGSQVDVLHALTHLLVRPDEFTAWHGPTFCNMLLTMADRFMVSKVSAGQLRGQFAAYGIKLVASATVNEADRKSASERRAAKAEAAWLATENTMKANLEALLASLGEDNERTAP